MSKRYTEILKLKTMLDEAKIPYDFEINPLQSPAYGIGRRYHIGVPGKRNQIISVVQGKGTYGAEDDLLEIMGLLTEDERAKDEVAGWLTAENVFQRIKNYYDAKEEADKQ